MLSISSLKIAGVLASHPLSRDLKIQSFSLSLYGKRLIEDTLLELSYGNRYGLIGSNGSGKSTFLTSLASRELPIPDHIDIFHLDEEAEPSDRTALEAVIDIVREKVLKNINENIPPFFILPCGTGGEARSTSRTYFGNSWPRRRNSSGIFTGIHGNCSELAPF